MDIIYNRSDTKAFKIKNDPKVVDFITKLVAKNYKPSLYSQYDETYSKRWCTLYGSLTCISTFAEIQKDEQFEEELREFAKIHGDPPYVENMGSSNSNGAKTTVKFRNQEEQDDYVYFEDVFWSDTTNLALSKGIPIQVGIQKGTKLWASQARKGRLLSSDLGTDNSRQHCIAFREIDWEYEFIDSNKKLYRVTKQIFKELYDKGHMFPTVRIFLPLKEISTLSLEHYKLLHTMRAALSAIWERIPNQEFRNATSEYAKVIDKLIKK